MLKCLYATNLNFKSNDKFNNQILVKYREEIIYCFCYFFWYNNKPDNDNTGGLSVVTQRFKR